ncbi:MAG TPA: ROK family protein [Pirellulales bacterium]|jgi:fructokinase|nr:ROK family protein [Pirellulales bacterium]
MRRSDVLVGGIEGGGTKWVCAVGTGPGRELLARAEFATGDDPPRLLATVVGWLSEQQTRHGRLEAIGIATFGPVDLHPKSPTYGFITSTPKLPWRNTEVVGTFRRAFPGAAIGFDTDVNGAALGEHFWGAAAGFDDFIYITIGTGIGAGGMARGRLLHGLVHPEMGHLRLPRVAGDTFPGVCPYHGDCWEGLCSGVAMQARARMSAQDIPPDDPAWRYETDYIAAAIANIVCALSPERVILGGSVRKGGRLGEAKFFDAVRQKTRAVLNGYVVAPALDEAGINDYIVPPQLADDAGVCGAIALAQCAAAK